MAAAPAAFSSPVGDDEVEECCLAFSRNELIESTPDPPVAEEKLVVEFDSLPVAPETELPIEDVAVVAEVEDELLAAAAYMALA